MIDMVAILKVAQSRSRMPRNSLSFALLLLIESCAAAQSTSAKTKRVKVIYDDVFLKHSAPRGHEHPECPARVSTIKSDLQDMKVGKVSCEDANMPSRRLRYYCMGEQRH